MTVRCWKVLYRRLSAHETMMDILTCVSVSILRTRITHVICPAAFIADDDHVAQLVRNVCDLLVTLPVQTHLVPYCKSGTLFKAVTSKDVHSIQGSIWWTTICVVLDVDIQSLIGSYQGFML